MCAWESDLENSMIWPFGDFSAQHPWLCFYWWEEVWDYWYLRWWCIDLSELFHPCECSDGRACVYQGHEAVCAHVCGDDEVGGGSTPCASCGEGEVPDGDGSACVACEHGESSTSGECNPDPCEGVTCPKNARCTGGQCQCDVGYVAKTKQVERIPGEPETELTCVDPCVNVKCGKNAECTQGTCECESGYEDPDGDGYCAKPCKQDDFDTMAKSSLLTIPKEPWEQAEWYSCENGTVTVRGPRLSTASRYLYTDYPTNTEENTNNGNVCFLPFTMDFDAGGHSHPHFVWPRDEGLQCGGSNDIIRNNEEALSANAEGRNFSSGDKSLARAAGQPLYLVVP